MQTTLQRSVRCQTWTSRQKVLSGEGNYNTFFAEVYANNYTTTTQTYQLQNSSKVSNKDDEPFENNPSTSAKSDDGNFAKPVPQYSKISKLEKREAFMQLFGHPRDVGKTGNKTDKASMVTPLIKFFSTMKAKKQLFTKETTVKAQTLRFHEGAIWTMKLADKGDYLCTGGQDCKVVIWSLVNNNNNGVSPSNATVVSTEPYRVLLGHTGDVIDVSWSQSYFVLSASVVRFSFLVLCKPELF